MVLALAVPWSGVGRGRHEAGCASPTGGLVGGESHLGVSLWWTCLCAAIFGHLRYWKFDQGQTTQGKEGECRALENYRHVLRCSQSD